MEAIVRYGKGDKSFRVSGDGKRALLYVRRFSSITTRSIVYGVCSEHGTKTTAAAAAVTVTHEMFTLPCGGRVTHVDNDARSLSPYHAMISLASASYSQRFETFRRS